MNIEQARFNMIEQQIRPWNVLDQDVLDLLHVVKREQFVPAAYQNLAFADVEIPLPGGDAMLAPKFEARILQETGVKKHETVLEIGTGSGYMAALLAHRAAKVTTVEINPETAELAKKNLANAGVHNVTVEVGNGAQGWEKGAPYDVIVISGALEVLPEAILKQVKVGGRIAAIVGQAPVMEAAIITRTGDNAYSTVKVFETNVRYLTGAPVPSHFQF
ncbi:MULTISPECIES: protein-L-isoaspartate O-methyltransferase family protein [Massilia]|jgi:protein-L-isoaspartate(D-aspartate) O-methyltransferase|uniref:Protein-L-isoaspartate O-methyltransferase n=2 Tax=Massilia TaxID=149698 RepID=A0A7X3G5Z4_9BURK|nr:MULTISPECIES: protein-L-isoaspartate O-methyltransferase [Telluria group]KQY17015.1 protein-L-isoaspartate O-methyltransferase [Massilia sp. Root133]KQZ46234.1 protein-L-isoaspartate O-methyltransferase [Massilia sp. Root1485]MDN4045254.1 protein-L-isoaspartate O-methyltransferase [Massilia sp. YIM B02787]MVW64075.1 methyltransferase domain-containing protein [Telluria cellulosilytica]